MTRSNNFHKTALERLHHYLSGYSPLTKAEFMQLLPFIEIREFDKKVKVIREGETERYLNIVARGLARKFLPLRNNEEVTIQLATEGHIIHSELSFHNRLPSRSVVETIEPTVLFSISYDSLQELYEKFPAFERMGRLRDLRAFCQEGPAVFRSAEQKHARALSGLCQHASPDDAAGTPEISRLFSEYQTRDFQPAETPDREEGVSYLERDNGCSVPMPKA
ncbi:Crp/Fnr family transcriptional regulator [Puia sp. P3]|uniref:Crp/Fnr family transcriptional regulator n=1 Tax=Puia sp. P3 TaxID=3423952 RepID=UPI003D66C244